MKTATMCVLWLALIFSGLIGCGDTVRKEVYVFTYPLDDRGVPPLEAWEGDPVWSRHWVCKDGTRDYFSGKNRCESGTDKLVYVFIY